MNEIGYSVRKIVEQTDACFVTTGIRQDNVMLKSIVAISAEDAEELSTLLAALFQSILENEYEDSMLDAVIAGALEKAKELYLAQ